MKKYIEFIRIEFFEGFYNRGAVLGRFGFYGIILFVFSRLWYVVGSKTTLDMPAGDMLWYLAMTELIVLSYPMTHVEIEEDVRTGNLSYFLARPVNYAWSRYCRALGQVLARMIFLSVAGVLFAYLFSGGWPTHPEGLLIFLPLALLAVCVGIVFHVVIGLCSFWIQDSSPIYWVWQKCAFVFGGMILPLDIYPSWLKSFSLVTPFASMLYGPAKSAMTLDGALAAKTLLLLLLWGGVGVFVLTWVFARASRGLTLNGG
jgi:ABC-2 type transport system permease protein